MLSRYQDTHYLKALRLSLSDIIRHCLCVWSHAHSIQMEKSLTFATMKACYSRLCSLCGWEACRPIPFPSPDIHIGCLIMSIDDNINMNIIINISISITFTWVVLFFELFFFFLFLEKKLSVCSLVSFLGYPEAYLVYLSCVRVFPAGIVIKQERRWGWGACPADWFTWSSSAKHRNLDIFCAEGTICSIILTKHYHFCPKMIVSWELVWTLAQA